MRPAPLLAAALLAACAAPLPPQPEPAPLPPTSQIPLPPEMQDWTAPSTGPTPLPARTPPAIVQSKLVAMPQAQVARWALPEHAAATVRVELLRGWMPEINLGWFFERPTATSFPGVCEVRSRGVNFRKYRENTLTYQQHLDPPLEPYQLWDGRKYRVLGSTLSREAATDASCAADLPYADWFDAPRAEAVWRAVGHLDRARTWPRDYRVTCSEMYVQEGVAESPRRPCDAAAFLEKLTPDLIKKVDHVPCEGPLAGVRPGPCWRVTYHDPRAPGTYAEFHALTGDGVVALEHQLLPPH